MVTTGDLKALNLPDDTEIVSVCDCGDLSGTTLPLLNGVKVVELYKHTEKRSGWVTFSSRTPKNGGTKQKVVVV